MALHAHKFAVTNGEPNSDSDEGGTCMRFIVVGKKCHLNKELLASIQTLDADLEISDTGFEFMNEALEDEDTCTVFVLDNFEGDIYSRLHEAHCRIMGPPAVIKSAATNQGLPKSNRPLYCWAMRDLVLCFTGFRVKEDLSRLADLVHHMGGSIRKDISKNVTHLVANSIKGEKYNLAISFGLNIMAEEWIHQCWEQRDRVSLRADEDIFMQYKVSPFHFCVIATYGFTKEEERDIEHQIAEYGGSVVEAGNPASTHLVVSSSVQELDPELQEGVQVVTDEWIWESVMLSACAREGNYRWKERLKTPGTPGTPRAASGTPMSGSKSRKRKKLKENLAQLASEGEIDTPMYKRRSSELGHQSCNQSFLDVTPDVSALLHEKTLNRENSASASSPIGSIKEQVRLSARQNTIMELFQTEKNYVGILHTLLKLFKEEMEKPENRGGGPILGPTEVKIIFGKIPPIYDIHMKIRDSLNDFVNDWKESCVVGDIYINQAEQLLKAYPPFVNFFETIKETVKNCDKTKPRFHAFLKLCQGKPECGRQTLTDLLIRLVQRLPSVILLLKEIHKKTDFGHPDKEKLEKAISIVEEVMLHINEDKRRTECHQMMFELYNDIENPPADLLSSSRTLLKKVDVVEISDVMQGRGENATIFLLSDQIEMCKRRIKVLSAKSPANVHVGSKTPQKAYKHCVQVPFNHVKRVLNIKDTLECREMFGLITKEGQELEKLYAFTIVEESFKKDEFLQMICKEVAGYKFRVDHESLLAVVDASTIDLQLDFTDIGAPGKLLGKAAARFGKRVSRAFSFKQTPRKLRRAISTMVTQSPLNRRDSITSMNSLTPGSTSGLNRANRMASCNDLSGIEEDRHENNDESKIDHHPISVDKISFCSMPLSEHEYSGNKFPHSAFNNEILAADIKPNNLTHSQSQADLKFLKSLNNGHHATSSSKIAVRRAHTFDSADVGFAEKAKVKKKKSFKYEQWLDKVRRESGKYSKLVDVAIFKEAIKTGEVDLSVDLADGQIENDIKDMLNSEIHGSSDIKIEKSPDKTKTEINVNDIGEPVTSSTPENADKLSRQTSLEFDAISFDVDEEKKGAADMHAFGCIDDRSTQLFPVKRKISPVTIAKPEVVAEKESQSSATNIKTSKTYGRVKGFLKRAASSNNSYINKKLKSKHDNPIICPNNGVIAKSLNCQNDFMGHQKCHIPKLDQFEKPAVLSNLAISTNPQEANSMEERKIMEELAQEEFGSNYDILNESIDVDDLENNNKENARRRVSDTVKIFAQGLKQKARKSLGPLKKNFFGMVKRVNHGEGNDLKDKYKDSPFKRRCSDVTKYSRKLKDKFKQFSKNDFTLDETSEVAFNETNTQDKSRYISPTQPKFSDVLTPKAKCPPRSKKILNMDQHVSRERFSYDPTYAAKYRCSGNMQRRSVKHIDDELDEISINSSIAPSLASDANMTSDHSTVTRRRETLSQSSSNLHASPSKPMFSKKPATFSSATTKKFL